MRDSGACDEHLLRERLIQSPPARPVTRIVVSVADWIADPDGLFVADFDLLSRIPALDRLDIVATDAILGSGFHERLHRWLPGLEEETFVSSRSPSRPAIMTPPGADPDTLWWSFRDREEELIAIARHLKADRRADNAAPLDRVAVVFKNPLPYLYLAADVFGSAAIPYRAYDAFPLAAEPAAAALDLVLDAADANFTRDALIALLRSPYFTFDRDDRVVTRASISALDRALSTARYLGDRAQLEAIEQRWIGADAAPAYRAAVEAAADLCELRASAPASTQLRRLLAFWDMRSASLPPLLKLPRTDSRETRARSAISRTLTALAQVHEAHHDPVWTLDDLSLSVRRAIEEQTFEVAPLEMSRGIRLLDDRAARYGEFDDLFVVGVVEPEWPDRPRRNIFYPPALLKSLGWPSERDRRSAADAHVVNLVAGAERRTVLSVFMLEDDALVTRSMQLDEVPRARLSTVAREATAPARIFIDEALAFDPIAWQPLSEDAATWARLRSARSDVADPRFHGSVPAPPARMWSVSALETYIGCPFRFFAQHVLDLDEEPTDEEVMDPRRQGRFVHEVFEKFFAAWQRAGYGGITPNAISFRRVRCLPRWWSSAWLSCPRQRRGLSALAFSGRRRLRGSAKRSCGWKRNVRFLSWSGCSSTDSKGSSRLRRRTVARELTLEAKPIASICSPMARSGSSITSSDGRRIAREALQLPIYGVCAEQRLRNIPWPRLDAGDAMYLAFKGPTTRRAALSGPVGARDGACRRTGSV